MRYVKFKEACTHICSRLLDTPYNHICNRGAGRYICSDCIYIQVLQFLCQITADCLRPCFNHFFAVTPCIIGLRKVLHKIFHPVGVLQTKQHNLSTFIPFAFLAAFMAWPKALKSYLSISRFIIISPYYILLFIFSLRYDYTYHGVNINNSIYCVLFIDY